MLLLHGGERELMEEKAKEEGFVLVIWWEKG